MMDIVKQAFVQRISGHRPSPLRAIVVSTNAGVVTYRLLRG
jgi:hypothetical protein